MQRRGEATVTPINAGQVMVRLGGDTWVMSADEARDLTNRIADALETETP
ncbi:Uncharacterised protein [Tsukamurella paurometabola]|uniref:Uncharacterized protein n=2 Tax=Tsukamurellaceae TaxID=85028 RepID=A0A3P8JW31_TSUPA|nr:Uncharacterised protein [Tsukamurella paurometabola]